MVITKKVIDQDTQIRLMNLLYFMKGYCSANNDSEDMKDMSKQLNEILGDL